MPTMAMKSCDVIHRVQLLPCTEFPDRSLPASGQPAGGELGGSCVQSRRACDPSVCCDEHHQPPTTTKDKQFNQCRSQFKCSYSVCNKPLPLLLEVHKIFIISHTSLTSSERVTPSCPPLPHIPTPQHTCHQSGDWRQGRLGDRRLEAGETICFVQSKSSKINCPPRQTSARRGIIILLHTISTLVYLGLLWICAPRMRTIPACQLNIAWVTGT